MSETEVVVPESDTVSEPKSDIATVVALPAEGEPFGEMSAEEQTVYRQLQARINHNINQLGLLEVRKSNLVGSYQQDVSHIQELMKAVARRLGVPSDHQFSIKGTQVISKRGTPPLQ